MKQLLFILMVLTAISCEMPTDQNKSPMNRQTITIDGCEYIESYYALYTNMAIYSLTHKGNCNNSVHKKINPL